MEPLVALRLQPEGVVILAVVVALVLGRDAVGEAVWIVPRVKVHLADSGRLEIGSHVR